MHRLLTSVLFVGLAFTAACDSVMEPSRRPAPASSLQSGRALPPRPQPPEFVTRTPVYPAPVIYILYREYIHKNPGLTSLSPDDPKYQRYLERRLRQLYPHKGYDGMMKDAVEEARRHRLEWLEYQRKLREWRRAVGIMVCDGTVDFDPDTGESCDGSGGTSSDPTVDPSWEGKEEFPIPDDSYIPALGAEIDSLRMNQAEVDQLYYQESLADGSFFSKNDEVIVASTGAKATIDDLIRAAGEGWAPGPDGVTVQVEPVTVAMVIVSAAVIGWKAWRVYQAAKRARATAIEYYPGFPESDSQLDAFRHIFWNVQMARLVGPPLAKTIGDNYEYYTASKPGPRAMDLHNNYIGYTGRYKNFRGRWEDDRWETRSWAERVRAYIDYKENGVFANGEYVVEFKDPNITSTAANAREDLVPNWKYIYFAP